MRAKRSALVSGLALLFVLGVGGSASGAEQLAGSSSAGKDHAGLRPGATGDVPASAGGSEAATSDAARDTGLDAKTEASADEDTDEDQPSAERRDGFMVGLLLGGAFGGASGYPNDADKIDREQYYTNTGVSFGGGGSLWVGGALTDWLTVGIGVSLAGLYPSDQVVQSGAVELTVEAFPAWALGGAWQEMGVYLKTGAGLAWVELAEGSDPLVDTGGASRLGFGLFYEGIRAWQISMGPFAGGDMLWSPSGFRPMGLLGWRTVLYTGP